MVVASMGSRGPCKDMVEVVVPGRASNLSGDVQSWACVELYVVAGDRSASKLDWHDGGGASLSPLAWPRLPRLGAITGGQWASLGGPVTDEFVLFSIIFYCTVDMLAFRAPLEKCVLTLIRARIFGRYPGKLASECHCLR